mmetsp:Transcript_65529/g.171695  ORF Transcript_65529/g.171695 Transcript_65529/m.171695 type:complete len:211 (-) Transcript_65529:1314-1946(-)
MHASTMGAAHSSPDRIRSRMSKIRGHSSTHVACPARSKACTQPKIHTSSSSLWAPSSRYRTIVRTSASCNAGGAGLSRFASTAKTWRRFSVFVAMKFFTPDDTSWTVRVTERPFLFSGHSSSTDVPEGLLASIFMPRCLPTRASTRSISRNAPTISADCMTAVATTLSSSAEALYRWTRTSSKKGATCRFTRTTMTLSRRAAAIRISLVH